MYRKTMAAAVSLYLFLAATAMILYGEGKILRITKLCEEMVAVNGTGMMENDFGSQEIQKEFLCEIENYRLSLTNCFSVGTEMATDEKKKEDLSGDGLNVDGRDKVTDNHTWNDLPEQEIMVLERIVEAEAGGEDADGKLLVANVVLNRVLDETFPNTVSEVVFQQSKGVTQFSPVANGRYDAVTISEESKEAVERALNGEDLSEGALYFAARKYANPKNMRWFDEHLTLLFQHGGHEFFK